MLETIIHDNVLTHDTKSLSSARKHRPWWCCTYSHTCQAETWQQQARCRSLSPRSLSPYRYTMIPCLQHWPRRTCTASSSQAEGRVQGVPSHISLSQCKTCARKGARSKPTSVSLHTTTINNKSNQVRHKLRTLTIIQKCVQFLNQHKYIGYYVVGCSPNPHTQKLNGIVLIQATCVIALSSSHHSSRKHDSKGW